MIDPINIDNYISLFMFFTIAVLNILFAIHNKKDSFNYVRIISALVSIFCISMEIGYLFLHFPHNAIGIMVSILAFSQLIMVLVRYRIKT